MIFGLDAISQVIKLFATPERTLKRRFKPATGRSPIEYLQNLRVEEAKRLLESSKMPMDETSAEAGYPDSSFLRRPFKKKERAHAHSIPAHAQAADAGQRCRRLRDEKQLLNVWSG